MRTSKGLPPEAETWQITASTPHGTGQGRAFIVLGWLCLVRAPTGPDPPLLLFPLTLLFFLVKLPMLATFGGEFG